MSVSNEKIMALINQAREFLPTSGDNSADVMADIEIYEELLQLRAKTSAAGAVPIDIEEYLGTYEWRTEDGGLAELTARDRHLLQDFANGLPLYAAPPAQAAKRPAKQRFDDCGATEECDPIERLRFFCSLAMSTQDWLDVEPFFDALRAQAASLTTPTLNASCVPEGWDIERLEDRILLVSDYNNICMALFENRTDPHAKALYRLCSAMLAAAPSPERAVSVPSDSEKLSNLLFHVERKFPGESRYETALRYIRNAESASRSSTACTPAPEQPK